MQKLLNLGPKLGRGGKGLVFQKVNCGNLCLSFCLFLAADELSFPKKKRYSATLTLQISNIPDSSLSVTLVVKINILPGPPNCCIEARKKYLFMVKRLKTSSWEKTVATSVAATRKSWEEKNVTIKLSRDTWGKSSVSNCSKFAFYSEGEKNLAHV